MNSHVHICSECTTSFDCRREECFFSAVKCCAGCRVRLNAELVGIGQRSFTRKEPRSSAALRTRAVRR